MSGLPFSDERPTPLLYWGIDFTETIAGLAQLHRLAQEGRGPGDPTFDALTLGQQGASKRAFGHGLNVDRPRDFCLASRVIESVVIMAGEQLREPDEPLASP
jgi:hypothetical protein